MAYIALILFACAVLAAIISAFIPSPPKEKLGKIYAHINNAQSINPDQTFDPFVALYTVEEIKDGRARLKWRTLHFDGRTFTYETWRRDKEVGEFDQEVKPDQ